MAVVWTAEECPDCGEEFERAWVTKLVTKGTPVVKPWRVVEVTGSWKTLTRPTRDATLCLCDAP